MKHNSKILFIAPALSMGGMERAAVNTANGLNESGFEVVFLSLFKKEHFFKLNQKITIIEPNGFNKVSLSLYESIKWIRSEVKKHNPDKVLVFNKLYGAITALALIGLKYDYFLSERSSPFFIWKFPFNLINKIAYTLNPPKGIIAQTQIAVSYQRKYFKKSKVVVIPNSVREVELYPEIKREKIILAVGRLNDYLKGFDLLLAAMALLKNKDWELHIAGGDEDGVTLKKQASDLGIANRIKFLGKVKDVDICYASAGIFVIPSRSEGFPNALAEAMAAGCCCVAFDFIAGPRDIINDGVNGAIVPQEDVQQMAIKIDHLINNSQQRKVFETNAIEIRELLAIDRITEKINQFLYS
jgi:GalNAc-alpha-(1->4)-GalNAc-alpha-(1->3)-diNAcBac-PP-undecaprenol alpha-1,4-N-acetyl-D-galactosaminyltransferase